MTDLDGGKSIRELGSEFRSRLRSGNVILLGAPTVGKTTLLEDTGIETVTSLGELGSHAGDIVALDPGFEIYLEYDGTTSTRLHENFDQLLNRESGVCFSLTPYEFDWLVSETDLDMLLTDPTRFDVIGLQFDRQTAITESQAIDGLQSVKTDRILEQCTYEYTLDVESLPRDEAYTYETYLPYVLCEIAAKGVDEVILPGDLASRSQSGWMDRLREIGEDLTVSEATSHLRDDIMNIPKLLRSIDEESIRQLGTGTLVAAAPTVAPAALSFAVVFALSTGDDEPGIRERYEQQLGPLLSDNMVAPTQELLERALDVPPGTLAAMDATRTPEFRTQVSHLVDRLGTMDVDLRSIDERVAVLSEELTDQTENVSVIADAVETSVFDLDTVLGESLRSNERKILRQDIGEDTVLGQVPDSGADEVPASLSDDRSVSVVTGPHGIGKSTTLYQAGKQLESEGANVLVPDVRGGRVDIETIKRALRSQGSGRTVLIVSYREGPREMTVHDVDGIANLIQLLDDGLCTEIIVESRIELLSDFTSDYHRARRSLPNTTAPEKPDVNRCETLDDEAMRDLAHEVNQLVGDELLGTGDFDRVVDVAEGVPEIGKIAARLLSEGRGLEGVHTARDVVWHDLAPLVNRFDTHSGVRRVLRLLATFRSLSRDELLDLTQDGFDAVDLKEARTELEGYVRIEEMDTDQAEWRLRPSVYTDVVFQEDSFEVVPQIVETALPDAVPTTIAGAIDSLAIAHQTAESQSGRSEWSAVDSERIVEKTHQVLRHLEEYGDGETYVEALDRIGRIPVDLQSLEKVLVAAPDGTNGLNFGIARQRVAEERVDIDAETAVIDSEATDTIEVLSRLITNHLETKTETDTEIVDRTIDKVITHAETGPGPDVPRQHLDSLVRIHTYSHCLDVHFSRLGTNGDKSDDEILDDAIAFYDRILDRLVDVATEFRLFTGDPVMLLSSPFRTLTVDWEIHHVIRCYNVALEAVKTIAQDGTFFTDSSPDIPQGSQRFTDFEGDRVHTFVTMAASIPPLFTFDEMSPQSAIAFYRYAETELNSILSQHNRDLADVSFDARERELARFNGLMIWGFSWMYPDADAETLVTEVVNHLSTNGHTPSGVPTFVSLSVGDAIKFLVNLRIGAHHARLIDGLAQRSPRSLRTAQNLGMDTETFVESPLYYLGVYTSILEAIITVDLEGGSETERMHRLTTKRIIILLSSTVDPEDVPYIFKATLDRGMNRHGIDGLTMILFELKSASLIHHARTLPKFRPPI